MHYSNVCHGMALGVVVLLAVAGTFAVGACAGAALNDRLDATSVARIPVRDLQPRKTAPPASMAPHAALASK